MNTVQCIVCENIYYSERVEELKDQHLKPENHNVLGLMRGPVKIQPWNCPNCNKDTDDKIQKDLNDLYKIIGFEAVKRVQARADRRLLLKSLMPKNQPENVLMF